MPLPHTSPTAAYLSRGHQVTIYSKWLRGGRKGCLVHEAKPIKTIINYVWNSRLYRKERCLSYSN